MLDIIAKKRRGAEHSEAEIRFIVRAAARADAQVPDYQLSAWLMAVCCRGMSEAETVLLTREMAACGARLDLSRLKGAKVDKHSTGGVGDGVSLALAPLLAAAGLVVPMMSGRGLGHTGGTLDKLEAMSGFKVRLDVSDIRAQLGRIGVCMFGQTEDLAPADRKLYCLRDATATVESPPLVVASILSKKLAEGLDALVLDVKIGSGAIFQSPAQARDLSRALVRTARKLGLKAVAVLTAMDQPLGRYVGNALEVRQALEVLRGDFSAADYVECLLALGGWLAHLGGAAPSPKAGAALLVPLIRSGAALASFKQMLAAQGADPRVADDPDRLPKSPVVRELAAPRAGYVVRLDARQVGQAAVVLGAGRVSMEQSIDHAAGFVLEKKVGDKVARGECVAQIHGGGQAEVAQAGERFLAALEIGPKRPKPVPVIRQVVK
ncbi:MAG: thymidine phosphorylase [Elusimicrobia bacterium]|nr:thymidine phosphorylase [Elusimicrobiota bacterium]